MCLWIQLNLASAGFILVWLAFLDDKNLYILLLSFLQIIFSFFGQILPRLRLFTFSIQVLEFDM